MAATPADMEAAVEEYQADLFSVSGFYWLPWSAVRFERMERLQNDWQGKLDALEFDRLDQHGRVDYLLLRTSSAPSSMIRRLSAAAWPNWAS